MLGVGGRKVMRDNFGAPTTELMEEFLTDPHGTQEKLRDSQYGSAMREIMAARPHQDVYKRQGFTFTSTSLGFSEFTRATPAPAQVSINR